jgi:hypothetical protein
MPEAATILVYTLEVFAAVGGAVVIYNLGRYLWTRPNLRLTYDDGGTCKNVPPDAEVTLQLRLANRGRVPLQLGNLFLQVPPILAVSQVVLAGSLQAVQGGRAVGGRFAEYQPYVLAPSGILLPGDVESITIGARTGGQARESTLSLVCCLFVSNPIIVDLTVSVTESMRQAATAPDSHG